MAFMSLKDIDVSYDKKKQILKGLSLDVEKGELVSLLGPSGCGKSTTLRVVAGFIDPQGGSFLLDGEDMTKVPVHKRNFGLVFQSYALFPHLSVYDNVAFGLRTRKMDKELIDKKVKDILEVCGLSDLANRFPRQMSGGQRQRVALARSLVIEPKLLLLDEPLSNLDAKLRTQMRIELAKLHREMETTIIYVTHDQTEAMTLGTKIVVMKDGFVQQVAPPAEIYNNPANLFVAGFIGAPSMNFFEAWVAVEDGRTLLYLGGNELGKKVYLDGKKGGILQRQKNGEKVILGIRPEDIYEYEEAKRRGFEKNSVGLEEKVIARELLGAEVVLYFQAQGRNQAVRLNPENETKRGENINLYFDTEKLYAFDMDTQENLFYKEDFTHE